VKNKRPICCLSVGVELEKNTSGKIRKYFFFGRCGLFITRIGVKEEEESIALRGQVLP
jgi:hypothetical protein